MVDWRVEALDAPPDLKMVPNPGNAVRREIQPEERIGAVAYLFGYDHRIDAHSTPLQCTGKRRKSMGRVFNPRYIPPHMEARNFAGCRTPICNNQNHLEERLLDQAQVRTPYTLFFFFFGSFVSHTQGIILDV